MKPGLIVPMGQELIVGEVSSSGMYEIDHDTKNEVFFGTVGVIRNITDRKRTEKI